MPKIAADSKVSSARMPSRDNQDDRHWEKARHARSGRPRWKTDDTSPPAANNAAMASAIPPKLWVRGNKPSGAPSPSKANSANPAPDEVVKKTIESAGCM